MGSYQVYVMEPLWEIDDTESDTVDGSDTSDDHEFDHYASEHGVSLPIRLTDGRMDMPQKDSTISICPVVGDSQMYYIRFNTNHYSFSIKRSCVTRNTTSFYQLRSILKTYHPYLTIPSLPLQASLLVYSYLTISSHLATFLAGVLAEKQLLSNKALHLFLQTQITMEKIMENMEGKRDDEVVVAKSKIIKDDRNNAKEGFGSLFGSVTQ